MILVSHRIVFLNVLLPSKAERWGRLSVKMVNRLSLRFSVDVLPLTSKTSTYFHDLGGSVASPGSFRVYFGCHYRAEITLKEEMREREKRTVGRSGLSVLF